MFRLVVISCMLAACLAQVEDKNAKILKEQRFNAGDGRAGAAFATENGVVFREETDAAGNRIGQYSYVGDDGQTYTVRYSAGKDGFRILDGAHVPSSGQDAAAFNPDFVEDDEEPAPVRAALPKASPLPLRPTAAPVRQPLPIQPQPLLPQQPVAAPRAASNENPFINPHDPTHRNFQFNKNAATFDPASPGAQQASLVPNCADCAGVNPFVNPFDASHNQAGLLAGHLAGAAPRRAPVPAPARLPTPVAPRPAPTAAPLPRLPAPALPTQAPRFFPPGQLKLNRFDTGFNFDFES